MKVLAVLSLIACVTLSACGKQAETVSYESISQEEAMERFEKDGEYLIVDVRRPDEFEQGHIKNAINIPNEEIGNDPISQLNDKHQELYVYCRSGVRSKQASDKLAKLGYDHVIEFGGIITWPGEIVKD